MSGQTNNANHVELQIPMVPTDQWRSSDQMSDIKKNSLHLLEKTDVPIFYDAFSVVWILIMLSCSCITFVTPLRLAIELRPTYALSTQIAGTIECAFVIGKSRNAPMKTDASLDLSFREHYSPQLWIPLLGVRKCHLLRRVDDRVELHQE